MSLSILSRSTLSRTMSHGRRQFVTGAYTGPIRSIKASEAEMVTTASKLHQKPAFEAIQHLYNKYGMAMYQQNVSQYEHACQSATFAYKGQAPSSIIVASLLHDLGHLLHDEAAAINGIDAMHEILGVKFLRRWFSDDVLEPIRLHVEAKRYAARDPTYFENLAEASLRSLRLQGGVFSDSEASEWIKLPFAKEAVHLRKYDDLGKIEGAIEGKDYYSLSFFKPMIESLATSPKQL